MYVSSEEDRKEYARVAYCHVEYFFNFVRRHFVSVEKSPAELLHVGSVAVLVSTRRSGKPDKK